MKKVKIFLASSIEELQKERVHLADFFNFLNEHSLDRGISFSLIKFESPSHSDSKDSQPLSVYDPQIWDGDICLFIFFKKVGDHAKNEFEIALENYQKAGNPYILTTIKHVHDSDTITQEVLDFVSRLDQELKHFYHFYSNLNQLELWIIQQILILKLDAIELITEGYSISINERAIANISNIPTFTGDQELMKMKSRCEDICDGYNTLRNSIIENSDEDIYYREYSHIASKKSTLEKEIKERSLSLVYMLQKIAIDTVERELSDRLIINGLNWETMRGPERRYGGNHTSLLSDLNQINSKIPFNQLPVFIFGFENIKRKSPFLKRRFGGKFYGG